METLFNYIFFKIFMFYKKHGDSWPFFMALSIIALLQYTPIICVGKLFAMYNIIPHIDLLYLGILLIFIFTLNQCHYLQYEQEIINEFSHKSKQYKLKKKYLRWYSILYVVGVICLCVLAIYLHKSR